MIVVSHRGPYQFQRADDGSFTATRGAGGVVSALGPLLLDAGAGGPDTTWIAAAMSANDAEAAKSGATDGLDVKLELLDLDEREHRLHYDVVSNGILWFLHHDLFDRSHRPLFDVRFREAWDAFVAVNERFADAVVDVAGNEAIVLVQDYQLALVPAFLRARRPDLRVVHFTHTPFCGPDAIRVLPDDVATALCSSLAGSPAGFHTKRWAAAFEASAREVLGERAAIGPTFAASLGPDPAALAAVAAEPAARAAGNALADRVGERLVILRTDRMEPSKNIVRGFAAYNRLLEARPGLRGRVVFVAMLYPSRETLPEYLANANEIEQAVARINDRWATRDWTPIILDKRDDFARSVAGMQRYDVLFVNPLKDGLNLVAKEGPLLNRRDGVVCLSREAGAYDELAEAVLPIQPYDIEQMAGALDDALAMPLDERAERAARVRELAAARTSATWLNDLLAHA